MSYDKMHSVTEYVNEILIAGTGVATSLVAWKQGQKTAKTSHLDNVEKAIEIWENTSDRLNTSLTNLQDEMVELRKNHKDCEESKMLLSEKVNQLENTMHNIIGTPKNKRK